MVSQVVSLRYLHGPGSLIIDLGNRDPNQQIFNHIDIDGTNRTFYVNRLYEIAKSKPENFPLIEVPLDYKLIKYLRKNIVKQHLKRITSSRLNEPGIMLVFDDEKHLIIDGNHRAVARFDSGIRSMSFYAFTEDEAKPAMLSIPERWLCLLQ